MPTAEPGDRPSDTAAARLTIDLAALAGNFRLIAARAAPAAVGAAVKADAYGLGLAPVATALHSAGARTFFVAWLEEGIALRRLLPDAEILCLNGLAPGAAEAYAAHRLTPVLGSLEEIAEWRATSHGGQAPAGLQIDSGMARLGLSAEEVDRLVAYRKPLEGLNLTLVMSHLASGDDPADPMNLAQRASFEKDRGRLGLAHVRSSLAASGGSFLGSDFHLDLVRPGAALYGLAPLAGEANLMAQVVRLQAKILQVRRVDRGMTVGYGATHRTTRPSRLATISAGYADGYPRSLSNRGHACLGSVRVPVVGRVSMDLLTLDVTDAPADLARRGAWVDLIGPLHSVDALATEAGTIGYEILTALGRRYARHYLPVDGTPGSQTGAAP
ncbi:MAG TPA: alanine racemase [Hypericibacter adhaerens]|jgi:alanine racemase|uniref:alanine racemase n=1 Tax=Hypericibacter adhaerens TaxID=2602016 RepID=UPI002C61EE25|nr:alanine racemase [Hypericibacter adhaerens]HWA43867.1 alanine racemase [Hypericibacter adhaerens]